MTDVEAQRGQSLYKLLNPFRPDGVRLVLDLGCGDGRKAAAYHEGLAVIGVEIDYAKAQAAAQRLMGCIAVDMKTVPSIFPADSVDWVTLMDALEHLSRTDGLTLIAGLKRIARKAITIFAPEGDVSEWRGKREGADAHLSVWTPEELKNNGFVVTRLLNYHGRARHAMIGHWRREQ